jgi:hypothetical protein
MSEIPPQTVPPAAPGATVARLQERKDSHWYTAAGEPCYEVIGKSTGRPRPTNLSDARARNLLPSVTTILKILHKEALVNWMIEQAVLAVVTTPRQPGEKDDAFIKRVLQVDKVHEQERDIARDKGTQIHDEIANYFAGTPTDKSIDGFIIPAITKIEEYGQVIEVEKCVVGPGYAGRYDLFEDCEDCYRLWDIKATKRLPDPKKGAWLEHRLQLAAYRRALPMDLDPGKPILCANIYISTIEEGAFVVCEHEDPDGTYEYGFRPLVQYWQWVNQHFPSQPGAVKGKPIEEQKAAVAAIKEAANKGFDPLPPVMPVEVAAGATAIPLPAPAKELPQVVRGKKVVWS